MTPALAAPVPPASKQAAPPSLDRAALIAELDKALKVLPHKSPAASLLVVSRDRVLLEHRVGMQPDAAVPLGRLGELLASILILKQAEAGKIKLDDGVNLGLEGFALIEPHGEISLRHLLQRSTGLPERESGIYVRGARQIPKSKDLLIQDIKPAVLPPGEAITHHSAGDVLQAQLLHDLSGKPFPELVQQQLIAPLGLNDLKLPDPKAKIRTLPGHDSEGFEFPALHGSAHDIHDWIAPPQRLQPLLQALLGRYPAVVSADLQHELLTRSLAQEIDLPTSSLGLLEASVEGQRMFYLDSDWFGHTLRLVVFPAQGLAFLLSYDSSHPKPADAFTMALASQFKTVAAQSPQASPEPDSLSGKDIVIEMPPVPKDAEEGFALRTRDSHSLLKAVDLFDPYELVSAESAAKAPLTDHLLVWPENGQMHISESEPIRLQQGYGFHGSFRKLASSETWPWQLAIAMLFGLLFMSVLVRAVRFIYDYEPPLEPESQAMEPAVATAGLPESAPAEMLLEVAESQDAVQTDQAEPEPTKPAVPPPAETSAEVASWDIPLVGLIPSVLAITFMAGIYPVMMQTGRIGDHLSLALRNEPSGWLLAWLAMPLIALITALILLALIAASWKERPWGKLERLHYLGLVLGTGLWAAWLTSWNLLGFRF